MFNYFGEWSTKYRDSVASVGNLPATGNNLGDLRYTLDTDLLYIWAGVSWILASTSAVASSVTVTNFPATQAISAASLPLPTGAATSTLQTTGNSSLSSIDSKTPALGQALATASVPVVLTAAQLTALTPLSSVSVSNFPASQAVTGTFWQTTQPVSGTITANAGTGNFTVTQAIGTNLHVNVDNFPATQPISGSVSVSNFPASQAVTGTFFQAVQPVSAASLPLPTGAATSANQTAANASLSSIDSKTPALGQALAAASVPVVLTAAQLTTLTPLSSISVSNFPATQPISGSVSILGTVPVSGAFFQAVQPVSQSGTWTTGRTWNLLNTTDSVNVGNFPAIQPVSGTVAVTQSTSPWIVSGTVTSNIGTTGGLAINSSVTGLQVAQGSVTSGQQGNLTLGAVTTAAPMYTAGQSDPISLTLAGALRVDGSGVTQPVSGTVTANAGTGTFLVDGSAHTQPISGTVTANAGTGTFAISAAALPLPSGASTSANQSTANTSLASIDSKLGTLGQKTMAGSAPVVIASDQSAIPVTGAFFQAVQPVSQSGAWTTGRTWNLLNTTDSVNVGNFPATVAVTQSTSPWVVSGTVTANAGTGNFTVVQPTGTNLHVAVDNFPAYDTNYGVVGANTLRSAAEVGNAAGAADFNAGATGAQTLRVAANTYDGAGTAITSTLVNSKQRLDVTLSSAGPVAAGTAAAQSDLVGGVFNSVLPTLTNTQQAALQLDSSGRLIVVNTPVDEFKTTYSFGYYGSTIAASPTDVVTLYGSATKTIRIISAAFAATTSSRTSGDFVNQFIKRSSVNMGGTSRSFSPVPHDSTNPAATATLTFYTANPTLGTSMGAFRNFKSQATAPSTVPNYTVTIFGELSGQEIVLRGTSEGFCWFLSGQNITGGTYVFNIEWTEE